MLFIVIISVMIFLHSAEAQIGACYGTLGANLPPPTEVIDLCIKHNVRQIRIFNPNPSILEALQGHNISVIVGIPLGDVQGIARDPTLAKSWVQNNILKYNKVNFKCIAVGNEISPLDRATSSIAPSVAPAMQNIHNALSSFGLGNIKVSTVLSMAVLAQSYPPSIGAFISQSQDTFIDPIVKFLVNTNSPFLINVYPYFAYTSNTNTIRLDYALFTSPSTVVSDGQYHYQNLFDAMVDSVHAALEKAGGAGLEVMVTETGWPSFGGTAATLDNAKSYNSNLIKSVRNGTPRKPGKAIETYIFDLIDENQKSPEIEKHWGIFLANKQPKYPLSF